MIADVLASDRDPSSPSSPRKRVVPRWMRDRAQLRTIQRALYREATGQNPLTPGTQRLKRVLDEAFARFEERQAAARAADAADESIPF